MIPTTVTELRGAIFRSQITETEVWDRHAARISDRNPLIHALVDISDSGPTTGLQHTAHAQQADDRPLQGIPIVIKANRDTQGLRTEHGSEALAGRIPTSDHPFVAAIRRTGAAIMGTAACSEFSLLPSCEPLAQSAVVNPVDHTNGIGGSSGGSAAAVAAGLVPLAHGNDAGGSLRLPAAACGLASMVTFVGNTAAGRLAAGEGFIANQVEDLLAAHRAMHMLPHDLGPPPQHPRVALILTAPDGSRAAPSMVGQVMAAAQLLDDWWVEEPEPFGKHPFLAQRFAALAPQAGDRIRELVGADDSERLEPYTREFLAHSTHVPPSHRREALRQARDFARQYVGHYLSFDVLISPIPPSPAPGTVNGQGTMSDLSPITGGLTAFTWPANIVRLPFVTVGSVQFASPSGRFSSALLAARRYEADRADPTRSIHMTSPQNL